MKYIFETLLFISSFVLSAEQVNAHMTPKSAGKTVDESYIRKQMPGKQTLYGKKQDAFTVLKIRADKNSSGGEKKTANHHDIEHSEFYTLETVNGEPITNVDVSNATKLVFFYSGKSYDKGIAKMMAPTVIESLEDDKLREQCARIFNFNVSKAEIDGEIERLAKMNGMSPADLENKFASAGISSKNLRKSIRSKLIFQIMAQSFAEDDKISNAEIEEIRREQQDLLNSNRYLIIEIFRNQREGAEKVLQLARKGFDFGALAENFSQAIKSGRRGVPRWVKASAIEPEVFEQLHKMKPGDISPLITTKSGYKIVALIDSAAPGKSASGNSNFRILKASVEYHGKLFTKADIKKAETLIEKILKAENNAEFQEICKDNKIKYKEIAMEKPNSHYRELITRSKKSGRPEALESPYEEGMVNIVMFLNEEAGPAKMPTREELKEMASEKKMEDIFTRNFKKIRAMAHIEKNQENIRKITQ